MTSLRSCRSLAAVPVDSYCDSCELLRLNDNLLSSNINSILQLLKLFQFSVTDSPYRALHDGLCALDIGLLEAQFEVLDLLRHGVNSLID